MGRHRNITLAIRKALDDYALDKITTSVKSTSVFQGVIDGCIEHASVLESGFARRQPMEVNEQSHLVKSLRNFEPTIYEAPKDEVYCIHCGEFRKRDKFSPDKRSRNGLQSWCKQCRSEHERGVYRAGKHRV